MNPCFETATRLARAIRNGRLSSVEATRSHLERIARENPALNALVVVDRDGALKAARAADRALAARKSDGMKPLGPLHGVPITIKEAFDVAGLRTTSSHPPLADNVATQDATLVARLRAAGAVILGKTNVPELCADFQTDSPIFGTTKNAWDERRTAGGSTGGGGVAVAARLSPLELGSDIGGSVRNPAHYNGIFSLKPTEWRVPGHGHVPDLPGATRSTRYMGTFGPLARSVDDLDIALRVIAGPDGYEAEAGPVPLGPTPRLSARGLRIAVLASNPLVPVSADTAAVVEATAKRLSKAGARVKPAAPDGLDWQQGWDDWADLFQYMILSAQPLAERERHFRKSHSTDPTARSVARAAHLNMAQFFAVLDRRDRLARQCETFLDDYDAWLMPVMPDAAFIRQSQKRPLTIDGVDHPYFFAGTAYNFLANLTGQPSIVLPCGFSKEGMPIGLQLTGRRWGEAKLLGVAKVLETLLPPCPVPPAYAS
ncbi:amidase [Reyranella aquatilis]|uniref:Amidase n=1 Tax=Reyranella aquatilis TaxID=2035356 RepID=A0ABS8KYJ3_9HYPH|nr:amidase [Reyranella aquatilis]MCC8431170.1 amidase [Reyranella aquatilis]